MSNPVRPEDVLATGVESTSFNGTLVRKGTIAAFLANITILEDPTASQQQKAAAISMMEELAAAVIAAGLHKHVTFKNPQVEQILVACEAGE